MARLHLHVCGGKPQDHWAHEDVALDSRTRPSGSIRAPPSKRTNTLIKTPLKRQQKPRRRPGFYFFLNAKKSTHFANTIAGEHGDSFIHLIDATQALTSLSCTHHPPVPCSLREKKCKRIPIRALKNCTQEPDAVNRKA